MENSPLSVDNPDRALYSISVSTVQRFAEHHLSRELSQDELECFENRLDKHLQFESVCEAITDCIEDVVERMER